MKMKPWIEKIKASKGLRWGVGALAALFLFLFAAPYFLDEALRGSMETKMNRALQGYSVRLPGLHLQLLRLSVTLKDLTVVQQAHPETPVAYFPAIKAGISWREVLTGSLVAKFTLERPEININLKQLQSEASDTVSLKERGWQQAVEEIYPLKTNTIAVTNAQVTYIDQDPQRPLVLSRLNLRAGNIRNIDLPDQPYPSTFHLDTAVFDTGQGSIDGVANFLAKPYPGIKGRVKLEKVPVDYFQSLAARSNLTIDGGVLGALGQAEFSPTVKTAHLENLTIHGMNIDYTHATQTAEAEKKRAALVAKTARELSNKPGLMMRADQVTLTACTLGMVNEAASKPYRMYLADTDIRLSNFSNKFSQGPAHAQLKAKFMGSGVTTASADFRPEKEGSDYDISLKVEESQLTAMNDVLRSFGNFDVTAGVFSLVTEIHVKNDAITGYIKPFFKDMKVYDKRQDKEQGIPHQMYEMLIGGASKALENRPNQQVATRVVLEGKVKNPETSSWQIVGELIKNAFFKAILPGFEKEFAGKR